MVWSMKLKARGVLCHRELNASAEQNSVRKMVYSILFYILFQRSFHIIETFLIEPPTGNADCPRKNGRFPIDKECSVYNECSDGVPTKVNCPSGKNNLLQKNTIKKVSHC